ncbi:Phage tail length tape-measure protein [Pediococcus damnosus]|uniref:phage tail tape measure protein n=1 Tax=Pediococcus damnosus TaxID=51663 RepID=UPI00078D0BE1|nr:phage tail tape measure protein [Pediococcus damnosus]AMV65204.1 Phage tail length tape-measure protein [Pediococcus damnosus]
MGETAGLNFDVFLNDHGMQKSMKELKSTASMLKSEMRSNFAELKSGGQVTDAYADKVKKSGEAIKAEQNVIDSAKKAQKGLDLQTEEGRKEYAKQETAISGAKKSIVSLTGEQNRAKESLNYYKSGMADMNKSMKNASNSSKAYVDRLRAEGKENQANKAQLTGLSEKYSSLSGIYKKQEEELNKISKSSGTASEAYLKQKTRLDQTGKAMAEAKIRTKSLNKSTGGLSTTMSRIADKGASLSKSLNNAGNKAIAFGKTSSTASLSVGAGFIYGSKKAIELQNSFKQTTNLIKNGGETQKAAISGVNKMQNDASADSVKYGKSQKSIADGYQDLVKRGYSSKQALGAMRSELQASVASGDDFKDVVTVSSQTLEAFGLRTKSTSGMISNTKKVTNELAYAADLTSTGFSDLGVGMSYVGSTAHQAGFSLSETAAAMGLLSNNGLEADKAGTGLRKAINSLISPTKGGTSALKTMNLSTKDFIDKKGNMKSMTDIFGLLKSHTDGMSKTEKTNLFHSLFGTTGQQAGLILAASSKQLGKLNDQVARSDKQHNGQGYVATLANQNMKTAKNQLARFNQAGEAVAIMFAKNVLPYITKIAVKMAGMLDKLGKMSPKTQKLVVGFGLVAAAIGPVSLAIGAMSKGISASIIGATSLVNWYGKLNKKMAVPTTSRAVSNGKGISNQWNSLNTGGKVATAAVGVGIAASAGIDLFKGIKAKNPDSKFKDFGKSAGTVLGGGIGFALGGPAGAAIGAIIGKQAGKWAGEGAKQFTDGWNKKGKGAKPPKGFLPKVGYYARSGVDAIVSWGKGFVRGIGNVIKSISNFNKRVGKGFGTVVKIIGNVLKPIKKVLEYALVGPIALVVGLAIKAWGKMKKPFKAVIDFIGKVVKAGWKTIKSITKSTWNAFEKYVINPVKAVWSAIDKYIVKTIVKAIQSAWNGIKSLTRSTWNAFKRYIVDPVEDVWNAINKYIVKKIVKGIKNAWGDIKSLTKAAWNLVKKYAVDPIVSVYNKVSSIMGKLKKVISSSTSSIKDVWHSAWKNVGDFFGDIWKSIKNHAKDGINAIIGVINAGVSGIDGVIHAFGGKEHAIGIIGKVHFATGTGSLSSNFRKSIDRVTPAIVNDEPGAKNPELIFRKATGNVEYMKGNNVNTLLMPGDEVANAHDSAVLAPQLGISHFASGGIGSFFGGIGSGISDAVSGAVSTVKKDTSWLKKLFTTATKIIKHPIKSVESLFKYSKNGTKGIFQDLGKGMFDKTAKNVKNWWSSLWSMVNLNGDGAGGDTTGLLSAVEKYGKGHKYVWGADGPNSFDCSGLVMYALKKAFGISYPHFSGSQYSKTKHISKSEAQAGDLVFWGPGKHVGVYAGGDKYYSAFSPSAHPNIGMYSLSGSVPGYSPLFGSVKGLSHSKGKSSKTSTKGIKGQVGSGFWKMISKLADKFGLDGSESNPAGDGVERWRSDVKKALKANGFSASSSEVAAWMRVISRESGGNPKAINKWDSNARAGHPSKGLVQTIDSTFNGNKFKGHDNIYNGFDDLLAGIHYMKAKYGSGASAFARVSGSKGYANGGFSSTAKLANISEGNLMESVIPLTKPSRAWELIGKSAAYLTKKNNSHTASANNNEGDSNAYMKQLVDQNSQLLKQISRFMSLVDAKPTGITPQAVYNANKQQATIQTNRYNRSLGLS